MAGSVRSLVRQLQSQHEKAAPPDGLIRISLTLQLVRILGIDEQAQTLRVLLYVTMVRVSVPPGMSEKDDVRAGMDGRDALLGPIGLRRSQ